MRFESTLLPGVIEIAIEPIGDERGFFARTWCAREATAAGLRGSMVQDSIGHNRLAGTLRGMHYHAAGFDQCRVLRCIAGAVHAVMLDLRPDSPAFLQHVGLRLDMHNALAVYLPPGLALGYLTLVDQSTVYYQMPEFYAAEHERGVRWNDPAFGIDWPVTPRILSERDAAYPDFDPGDVAGLSVAAGRGSGS